MISRLDFTKRDSYGHAINPGDVCVRIAAPDPNRRNLEYCVYDKPAVGGNNSKGEFGIFITHKGTKAIKYSSVLFVYDSVSGRKPNDQSIKLLIKQHYEGVKK